MLLSNYIKDNATGIIIALVVIIALCVLYKVFFADGYEEVEDEQLGESIAKYRETILNKIITYIFYKYNITEQEAENAVTTHQPSYDHVLVDISMDDMSINVSAHFARNEIIISGQQILPQEIIIKHSRKIKLNTDTICDYAELEKFLEEFNSKIVDWQNATYEEVLTDMAQIAMQCSNINKNNAEQLLFNSVVDFANLIEDKKYRGKEFTRAYIRLLTYIYASDKNNAMVDFIKSQQHQAEIENKEEV